MGWNWDTMELHSVNRIAILCDCDLDISWGYQGTITRYNISMVISPDTGYTHIISWMLLYNGYIRNLSNKKNYGIVLDMVTRRDLTIKKNATMGWRDILGLHNVVPQS